MPIFYAEFAEATSLLFDAEDEPAALLVARDLASGEEPTRIAQLPPRALCLEIAYRDVPGSEEEEELDLDPFPHTLQILQALEEGIEVEACGEEADAEDGSVVQCTHPRGHDPPHVAATIDGAAVTW